MSAADQVLRRSRRRQALVRVGLVALVMAAVVASLLLASWRSGGLQRTVQSPVLAAALAEGRRAPADAAQVAWVRDMDRLARHAYFTSLQFQRRGVILLAVSLLAALVCFQWAARLGWTIEDPRRYGTVGGPSRRQWIVSALALLGVVVLTGHHLLQLAPEAPPRRAIETRAVREPPGAARAAPIAPVDDARLAQAWTQFRGPGGRGVAAATNTPAFWNPATGEGIRWQTPLAQPGFSSPIVWEDRVFLTAADERERAVLAFDLMSGAPLWRQVVAYGGGDIPLPTVTDDTGYAAPTPACDGVRVFALFGTGDLAAFTLAGEPVWQQHLGAAAIDYGHASSPVYHGGLLIVQGDRWQGGFVKALDPATGDIRWARARDHGPSWSTPVIVPGPAGGVLLHAGQATALHRLDDGAERWRFAAVDGEIAPSPAWDAGRVYVAQEYDRLVAFPGATNAPAALWEFRERLPNVASPVAADGRVWMVDAAGSATCIEGATGRVLWTHDFDEGFYASPVIGGGRLYLVDRQGTVHVLATGPAFELIASHRLGAPCNATPALGEGWIVFRTAGHLICGERSGLSPNP